MASSRNSSKPLDLSITIVSAKHLKNVNWRRGDLKPYAIFWLDQDSRMVTKPDDAGCTRPVWNEHFTLPITMPLQDSLLTLEIYHSKLSDTPKPLVGTLTFPLNDLTSDVKRNQIRSLPLIRPSGRPQGKIRIKLSICSRPNYHPPPPQQPRFYPYHHSPLQEPRYYPSRDLPPTYNRNYSEFSNSSFAPHPPPSTPPASPYICGYPGPYSYNGGYPHLPPSQPFLNSSVTSNYTGPSAPVDYSSFDQKRSNSKSGLGPGLSVDAAAGALGGLGLEEGEEKIDETVGSDNAARGDYTNYRSREY